MDISPTVWLLLVIAAVIGIIIGFLIGRFTSRSGSGQEKHQLKDLQQRFDEYQENVASHFASTANLMKKMNQSYQDVQVHMAEGVQRLTDDEVTRQQLMSAMLPDNSNAAHHPEQLTAETAQEAPKDYAPKTDDSSGTLDETYGLKNKY